MNALVVGSGGREHALAWALERSGRFDRVLSAPGNAGTPNPVPVDAHDPGGLAALARQERVGLVVIGPEGPLAAGVADALRRAGLPVVGPSREAARIEASKAFAKTLMEQAGVPTAPFRIFYDPERAEAYVRQAARPLVVKADGLAGGKGAFVCDTPDEAAAAVRALMVERALGDAGRIVVVEDRLEGAELSLMVVTDGERLAVLPPARDYKRLLDGDLGPNTGGMGAVAPVEDLPGTLTVQGLLDQVVRPVLRALAARGTPFRGVLYAGLMLTEQGPRVLEFNCRPGDPETQAQVAVVDPGRLAEALLAAAGAAPWPQEDPTFYLYRPASAPRAACGVVVAAEGYPAHPRTGDEIEGLDEAAAEPGVQVFHAATRRRSDGRVETAGGRVLNVVGVGASRAEARDRAYRGVSRLRFAGMQYRRDIGG